MKSVDQKYRDRNRRAYKLVFPTELPGDAVTAWVRAISGSMKAYRVNPSGTPSIVFETWATSSGISHRLRVPWQHADFIVGQLRSLVPGIRVTPDETPEFPEWKAMAEVGVKGSGRGLRIYNQADTAASLLAAIQGVQGEEKVMAQWVVSPMVPHHPPVRTPGDHAGNDVVTDVRKKLEEPNLQAVLRVAATAGTKKHAEHLVHRVHSALAATRGPGVRFNKRTVWKVQNRIDLGTTPIFYPAQLSAPELATLIAWPIGNPFIAGLPPAVGKMFPPSDNIPREGIVIGSSTFHGAERPIAIGYAEALMHTWVGGSSGAGKSALLANMARQIMLSGYGLVLIETEGSLYENVLDYVPASRLDDVVLLDVNDGLNVPSFNVLDQGTSAGSIDQLIELLMHRYQKSMWAEEQLYFGLRTIAATPGLAFTDLAPLLVPRAHEVKWADAITDGLTDPELRRWWQRQDNRDARDNQRRSDPLLSRIWQLASRPELRLIMGQSVSSIRVDDVLANHKILLVNLKGVSKETAALAGTLIVNTIWQERATPKQRPVFVMLDEFADFMDLPTDMQTVLAQARKHNIGMVLANQQLGQLTQAVQEGVIGNARNKIVLNTSNLDAKKLAREMGPAVEELDLTSLPVYEGLARLLTPAGVAPPVSIRTHEPFKRDTYAKQAQALSRQKHTRSAAVVTAEIEARHETPKPQGPRPTIGSLD